MEDQEGSSSSSREYTETMTIAYTESHPKSKTDTSEPFSTESSSSSTLETPTSKISVTAAFDELEQLRSREETFGYVPVWRSVSFSEGPKSKALNYFMNHTIFRLFSFLISHLLADSPEEPIPYLISLIDRCLQYRDKGGDPPLLFSDSHIMAVYNSLDPLAYDSITYNQYMVGMETLGLTYFNIMPQEMFYNSRLISSAVFLFEARNALLEQLDHLVGRSQPSALSRETLGFIKLDTPSKEDSTRETLL